MTTQNHGEMASDFFADQTGELVETLGPEITARARASRIEPSDMGAFAESRARFFERAQASRSQDRAG